VHNAINIRSQLVISELWNENLKKFLETPVKYCSQGKKYCAITPTIPTEITALQTGSFHISLQYLSIFLAH
jgi:hypothetical protein